MNGIKRITKNISLLFVGTAISRFLAFIYFAYMVRYLGPANYGIIAFALALNGIFGVITNFGLDPLIVREVARNKTIAKKYLSNGVALKILFGLLTFLSIALVVNIVGYPIVTKKVVYLITISTIIAAVNNIFYDIYQAFEQLEYKSLSQVITSTFSLLLVFAAIIMNLNVIYFAIIYVFVGVIALGYNVVIVTLKFIKPKIEIDLKFWKENLREAWPFAISSVFVAIYFWIDSIMLSYMKGNEVVGVYNAAYRLVYLLLIIPGIYFQAVYPVLSKAYVSSLKKLKFIYIRSLKYFAILGIYIGIITILFGDKIILWIFGEQYLPSVPALKILIWAVVMSFMAFSPYYTLNSINKQIIYTKITALGALLNFVMNIYAILRWSYIGASVTTVITEAFGFFAMFIYLKSNLRISLTQNKWIIKLVFVIAISLLIYYLTSYLSQNVWFLYLWYTFLYVTGIYFLKIIDKKDIEIIRSIIGRDKIDKTA
ncbi:MatE family [Aciduliprofundum boonei T469]|nr:MatE family [Aciduliprofundum boonei T469]